MSEEREQRPNLEEAYYFQTLVAFESLVDRYGAEQVAADMAPPIKLALLQEFEK